MMDGMFGGMWFCGVFWILILVLIIWIIAQLTRKKRVDNLNNFNQKDTPLEILQKRYVKGEITKQQFDEMRNDLQ